jgi:hypothetical protein
MSVRNRREQVENEVPRSPTYAEDVHVRSNLNLKTLQAWHHNCTGEAVSHLLCSPRS